MARAQQERFAIHAATGADVAAIESVVLAAYGPWAARFGWRPLPLDADYRSLVASGQVYVTGSGVDGILVLATGPEAMGVENIAVRPDVQRRGIGAHLMSFAQNRARNKGILTLELYTHSMMTDNIAWYANLGFVETGRDPLPIGERVHMAKDLDASPIATVVR